MVNKLLAKGRKIFISPQNSVLSAATVIMLMIVASRVLGLIRQRALAHFFSPSDLGIFFAAFRLPDLIFEVLVFGTFSSAFIPVFASLARKDKKEAWRVASSVTNIGVIVFTLLSIVVIFASSNLYSLITPGFSLEEQNQVVNLTKILFIAQGFFVVSYVLTGVLESLKHFIIPAMAPIFYNLGIIAGTILFSEKFGLMAPAMGVVLGAFSHFMIQLPFAIRLGFKFKPHIFVDDNIRKIGKLALPRVLEVSFLQISKLAELYFSSLLSAASYTYYTFGNSLQLLPVGLFGTSIAKAALPTLSGLSDKKPEFTRVLWKSLFEMTFLITPIAMAFMILRVPIVRLVYGTDIFTWEATVQTGWVLTCFAFSIIFQSASSLLARGFYALSDTKTPVLISIFSIVITIISDFILIKLLGTPIWGLAAAFSIGSFIQASLLFHYMSKELNGSFKLSDIKPFFKHIASSFIASIPMFFVLKFFDQSVWVKRLSFIVQIDAAKSLNFQKFVLDTRYTANLLVLTVIVGLLGIMTYFAVSYLFKVKELASFYNLFLRFVNKKERPGISSKDESLTTSTDMTP